jgi:hypothetical protein
MLGAASSKKFIGFNPFTLIASVDGFLAPCLMSGPAAEYRGADAHQGTASLDRRL